MYQGYIKLHRKIIETSFYKNPLVCRLAIHCIIKANHKEKKIIFNFQELIIKPGQFISGRSVLSNETGISQQSIRTSLKILEKIGFLTSRSTNRFSLITVNKYEHYQIIENNQPSNQPTTNQQLTSYQPATNQQLTTNNNDKNDKNDKNKDKTLIVRNPSGLTDTDCSYAEKEIISPLQDKINSHRPRHKKVDDKKALKIIGLMIKRDGRTLEEIAALIAWYPIGEQYMPEIYSFQSLRDKYDKLYSASKRAKYHQDNQTEKLAEIENNRLKRENEQAYKILMGEGVQ